MLGAGVVRACDFRFHTVSCGFRLLYWNVADVAGPYQSAFTESHSLKIKKITIGFYIYLSNIINSSVANLIRLLLVINFKISRN
jgi:hypothetical protein